MYDYFNLQRRVYLDRERGLTLTASFTFDGLFKVACPGEEKAWPLKYERKTETTYDAIVETVTLKRLAFGNANWQTY